MKILKKYLLAVLFLLLLVHLSLAQSLKWSREGNAFYQLERNELVLYQLSSENKSIILGNQNLVPQGENSHLVLTDFYFSPDEKKILLYANAQRVWRINTKGEYWLYDLTTKTLKQLGKSVPRGSMMFAKFSPDASKVAYVSEYNLYVEDLNTGNIKQLTTDGNRKLINGTFDWAYEEEFFCRDGFRWSPDGKFLAYWQIDATDIDDFLMINYIDSVYSTPIPVEYPKVGKSPSACRIGIIDINTAKTTWLNIEGDKRQHYLVRLDWLSSGKEVLVQQLNRKQNESKIYLCNAEMGSSRVIYVEKDEAWIDFGSLDDSDNAYHVDFKHQFHFLPNSKEILWLSEKDGWRHLYRISQDGKKETLITKGNYDVMGVKYIDEKNNWVYFLASPTNATQAYLYRTRLDGKGNLEMLTPANQSGTHNYEISPNGIWAVHTFSNTYIPPSKEIVNLTTQKPTNESNSIENKIKSIDKSRNRVEFFKITTSEGVEMDGWMVKPSHFDPNKKYPVVFYVYSEPAAQTVTDTYGTGYNFLYQGDMTEDGYIYISLDGRGTPAPKGRAWRKAIYRKIGVVNIKDQALAAKEILKWKFIDPERVAVWGWSGGGSATLNLLFQYPDIYKTGIAIAAVANQLTYDNIYQERYMGLPQENLQDFIQGSPITHAKNLIGNLLYIHGTHDDNVHYQNAEMLLNELIKHNRQFQFMAYPNRSHSLAEGEGTFEHLSALFTNYLRTHCPAGGK
ncbi:MAG: S9 family peptidase [Thermoflexibacter sp.]